MAIPVVDISALADDQDTHATQRACSDLVQACHEYGFATIVGHSIPSERLADVFGLTKNLFALPHDEKMKAPHPPGAVPHRGYSAPGVEKVYATAGADDDEAHNTNGESLRKIEDFKESYEVGSEENKVHYNIWLPEETLPGFRKSTSDFYWELNKLARSILDGFATGLGLSHAERDYLMSIHTGNNNQLRLLHYPPVSAQKLESSVVARMPAHTDWSFFTMLFQDDVGGLELENPKEPGSFVPATPRAGSLTLNIGDMLMRLTNGYFTSALHRVAVPPAVHEDPQTGDRLTPARYSIPYFVAPDDSAVIKTFATCVRPGQTSQFETLRFCEYEGFRAKYSYRSPE